MCVAEGRDLKIRHALPGRLRIELPEWTKAAPELLARHLCAIPGVQRARASELTQTVLIHFDPGQIGPEHVLVMLGKVTREPHAVPGLASERMDPPVGCPGTDGAALMHLGFPERRCLQAPESPVRSHDVPLESPPLLPGLLLGSRGLISCLQWASAIRRIPTVVGLVEMVGPAFPTLSVAGLLFGSEDAGFCGHLFALVRSLLNQDLLGIACGIADLLLLLV